MASDNFNRADAGNLGANWTNQFGSIDIVSNQAKKATSGTEYAFYSGEAFPGNHYSQIVVAGSGTGVYLAPTTRASSVAPTENFYMAFWGPSGGAAQGLYKVVNGSASLLQSIAGDFVVSDVLKLMANGSTLQCLKNGGQLGTDQSDGALSAGSPGIYINQNASAHGALDDWEGGALVADPVPAEIIFQNANA